MADIIYKEESTSTNDDARDLAVVGASSGTAVVAKSQSRGRGRAGRSFESPVGGLYLSVVLRPTRPAAEWSLLPLLAGVVVTRFVPGSSLKWPNDVLVGEKKAGGILVESVWGAAPFAVVGIGLNVLSAPVLEATTTGVSVDASALRDALVARVLEWEKMGSAAVLAEIREACSTIGKEVVWVDGAGRAVDIDVDGALVVESPDGRRERVVAGDVRVRSR